MKRILMTGAGAPGGPGILKCLKLLGDGYEIYTADANEFSSGKFLSNNFFLIPSADNNEYVDHMLALCGKHKIDILFPLVTKELLLLSRFKLEFEKKGTKVIVSDYTSLVIANNKSSLYSHVSGLGLSLPDFRVINNYNSFKEMSEFFLDVYGGYCIKPSISNGSRGVRLVQKNLNSGDLMFKYKPDSLYIQHSQLDFILKEYKFPELLLSEILPGKEYTIDTVIDQSGQPVIVLPRERLKTNGGISISGKFVNNEEINDYCIKIIKSLKLFGPIGLQVKEDKNGTPLLLEINPRIQGTSVSSLGLGINLPEISVNLLQNKKIDFPEIEWGLNFIRYYEEVYFRS